MSLPTNRAITVALVDDYDVVVKGVANMVDNYRDRVVVAELDATMGVKDPVDIVLRLVRPTRIRRPRDRRSRHQFPRPPGRGLHLGLPP